MTRLPAVREDVHDMIGFIREDAIQFRRTDHRYGFIAVSFAAIGDHLHMEGRQEFGKPLANRTVADDQNGLPFEWSAGGAQGVPRIGAVGGAGLERERQVPGLTEYE